MYRDGELKKNIALFNWEDESVFAFDDFLLDLTYFDKYLGKKAYIKGRNLDWRGSNGTAEFILNNSEDMYRKLVPQHTPFNLEIKRARGRNTYQARCSHHDCPTGSYFNISFRGNDE